MVKRMRSGLAKPSSDRRHFKKPAPTTSSLAYRVAKLESSTEWKSKDFYRVGNSWDIAGTVTSIFSLAQGAGSDQRIGRKVKIRSVQLRFVCQNEIRRTTSGASDGLWPSRTMIVYDKQANAGLPSYSDIVADNLGAGDEPLAFKNLNNKERFVILYDNYDCTEQGDGKKNSSCRTVVSVIGGGSGELSEVSSGAVYRTMDMDCVFGLTNEPITGAIYVVTCGGATSADTTPANGKWVTRVRYVDE